MREHRSASMTGRDLESAYIVKPPQYFSSARRDIIDDLPRRDPKLDILEVGCGTGATLVLAKCEGKANLTVGIELDRASADIARRDIDTVVVGNIEELNLPIPPESFDVLIMSEVLEHLIDPWAVLKKLRPFLRPSGLLYASSPNVAHISVLRQILRN